MCHPCHFHRPTGLEDWSQNATNIDPVLKCVILATFKGQLVKRPLEALGDLQNYSKASKLTKIGLGVKIPEELGLLA